MRLGDVISTYAIPAVALFVGVAAALRARDLLPGSQRDRQGLAVALAGLAIGTTALWSPVYAALTRLTGVANIGAPIARSALMTCAVGILVMVSRFAAIAGGTDPTSRSQARWLRRRRTWLVAAVVLLWACFAVGPQGQQVQSYLVRFASDPAVQVYGLNFVAFVGGAFAELLRLGLQMRATMTGQLVTSGWLISVGAGAGCSFVALRLLGLISEALGRPGVLEGLAWPGAALAVTASIFLVSGTLWLAALARARAASDGLSAHATSMRLYPLWSDLVRLRPVVAMEPDAGRVREVLDVRQGKWRLYRRVIELRDAVRILQSRSVRVAPVSTSTLTSPGAADAAADRSATALADLVTAESSGTPSSVKVVPVAPAAATVDQEVAWWSRVAHHYRRRRRQARRHLDEQRKGVTR